MIMPVESDKLDLTEERVFQVIKEKSDIMRWTLGHLFFSDHVKGPLYPSNQRGLFFYRLQQLRERNLIETKIGQCEEDHSRLNYTWFRLKVL
jgi:hypothetical protein